MNQETRALRSLRKLIANEDKELARSRMWGHGLAIVGWVGVFASILESLEPHWPLWIITCTGSVGGLCAGVSIMLKVSLFQWPVIRRFLNVEAIESAQSSDAV